MEQTRYNKHGFGLVTQPQAHKTQATLNVHQMFELVCIHIGRIMIMMKRTIAVCLLLLLLIVD